MNNFDDLIELGKLSATITGGNQSKPDEIFKRALDLLNVYFKADWCIIRKLDELNQNLEIIESSGLSSDELVELRSLTTSSWVYSHIVLQKKPLQVDNLNYESLFNNEIYITRGILSFIATPIIVNDRVLGSIKIYSKKPKVWKKTDMIFLNIVASQLSMTMDNYDKMNGYRADYQAILSAIIKLLEIKDKYTSGHSSRVSYYAVLIAKQLKLSMSEIKRIEIAATLHDIGKIVISDEILNKSSKLSEEEFIVVKKHSFIGATVLRSGGFCEKICETVEQHHEWWNGKGYPYGISGDMISLNARIVAVADAYETMTSHRPYHKIKSHDEAIVELVRCSGTQFCPTIVKVFLSIKE